MVASPPGLRFGILSKIEADTWAGTSLPNEGFRDNLSPTGESLTADDYSFADT